GLLPNKREWEEQRAVVGEAVEALSLRGVEATGRVIATRKAMKRIVSEAARLVCRAIVIVGDVPHSRLVPDLMWLRDSNLGRPSGIEASTAASISSVYSARCIGVST